MCKKPSDAGKLREVQKANLMSYLVGSILGSFGYGMYMLT